MKRSGWLRRIRSPVSPTAIRRNGRSRRAPNNPAIIPWSIFDLDNFKQTNDLYGHPAGDSLLRQFATELRGFFRSSDIVSRWGGDEFLVIVDCTADEVHARIDPIRKWVCGDYTIEVGGQKRKVKVDASIGVASWRTGETAGELVARADAAMYQEKAQKNEWSRRMTRMLSGSSLKPAPPSPLPPSLPRRILFRANLTFLNDSADKQQCKPSSHDNPFSTGGVRSTGMNCSTVPMPRTAISTAPKPLTPPSR